MHSFTIVLVFLFAKSTSTTKRLINRFLLRIYCNKFLLVIQTNKTLDVIRNPDTGKTLLLPILYRTNDRENIGKSHLLLGIPKCN